MKKEILIMLCLILCTNCFSQLDSIKISPYFRVHPVNLLSYTQNTNSLDQRISSNAELGFSYQSVDIGLAYITNIPSDDYTKKYKFPELKLNLNTGQYGIFSNELCVGAGYASKAYLLEYSTTVIAQVLNNTGIGVIIGSYNITSNTFDYNRTFYGVIIRYGLNRDNNGMLNGYSNILRRISHRQKRNIKH